MALELTDLLAVVVINFCIEFAKDGYRHLKKRAKDILKKKKNGVV